jgi:hypothetical protein
MGRYLIYLATIAIATIVSSGARSAPVGQDDFLVATSANLISLCSAVETDPLYTPARNFCEGFAVGTYRLIATEEAATQSRRKLFCIPANGPTRDQAIAGFVQWASGRPKTLASSPTDGLVEYLIAQYPCT